MVGLVATFPRTLHLITMNANGQHIIAYHFIFMWVCIFSTISIPSM